MNAYNREISKTKPWYALDQLTCDWLHYIMSKDGVIESIERGDWQKRSDGHQKQYKHLLKNADKNKVLKKLPGLHEEAFSNINCLDCAACCKNYSPRFKTPD